MKNNNWRRIALILMIIVGMIIAFEIGVGVGAIETAKWMINQIVKFLEYKGIDLDISKIDMLEYYQKVKGGI